MCTRIRVSVSYEPREPTPHSHRQTVNIQTRPSSVVFSKVIRAFTAKTEAIYKAEFENPLLSSVNLGHSIEDRSSFKIYETFQVGVQRVSLAMI
jgi:hypothetical protein